MKLLATIESVKVLRQRQNNDGTWSPVYGIKLVSGDDEILAESHRTKEGLIKAGIVKDAVGKAHIEFEVKEGKSDKTGKDYCFQSITLRDFSLANRNLNTDTQAPATEAAPAAPAADPAPAPQEPAGEAMPSDGLTF
jgi:hypothetical protein